MGHRLPTRLFHPGAPIAGKHRRPKRREQAKFRQPLESTRSSPGFSRRPAQPNKSPQLCRFVKSDAPKTLVARLYVRSLIPSCHLIRPRHTLDAVSNCAEVLVEDAQANVFGRLPNLGRLKIAIGMPGMPLAREAAEWLKGLNK